MVCPFFKIYVCFPFFSYVTGDHFAPYKQLLRSLKNTAPAEHWVSKNFEVDREWEAMWKNMRRKEIRRQDGSWGKRRETTGTERQAERYTVTKWKGAGCTWEQTAKQKTAEAARAHLLTSRLHNVCVEICTGACACVSVRIWVHVAACDDVRLNFINRWGAVPKVRKYLKAHSRSKRSAEQTRSRLLEKRSESGTISEINGAPPLIVQQIAAALNTWPRVLGARHFCGRNCSCLSVHNLQSLAVSILCRVFFFKCLLSGDKSVTYIWLKW